MIPGAPPVYASEPILVGSCDTRSVDLPILLPTPKGLLELDLSWMSQPYWSRIEPWDSPADTGSVDSGLEERSAEFLDYAARQLSVVVLESSRRHLGVTVHPWIDHEIAEAALEPWGLGISSPQPRVVESVVVRRVPPRVSQMRADALLRDMLEDG